MSARRTGSADRDCGMLSERDLMILKQNRLTGRFGNHCSGCRLSTLYVRRAEVAGIGGPETKKS